MPTLPDDIRRDLGAITERVAVTEKSIETEHQRTDKMEQMVREDLKEMREDFRSMMTKLDDVIAFMNRGRGWVSAVMFLAGTFGGAVAWLLQYLFGKRP